MRMISPLHALSCSKVRGALLPGKLSLWPGPATSRLWLLAQVSRKAAACISEYNSICGRLLDVVLAQGPPADSDNSVGAALRRARHLSTGNTCKTCPLCLPITLHAMPMPEDTR